jgi:hypothetical protein
MTTLGTTNGFSRKRIEVMASSGYGCLQRRDAILGRKITLNEGMDAAKWMEVVDQ